MALINVTTTIEIINKIIDFVSCALKINTSRMTRNGSNKKRMGLKKVSANKHIIIRYSLITLCR